MNRSAGGSIFTRKLPLGCEQCIRGEKLVFFIGGECDFPEYCRWYCPISEERKGKPAKFVNERVFQDWEDLWDEIAKADARGMSITGGDPLVSEELRTFAVDAIRLTKEHCGADFHIHLYTNGVNFTPEIAQALASAGLDEIRFHPAPGDFGVFEMAHNANLVFGAEVPAIPTEDQEQYLEDVLSALEESGGTFLNLNELEMTPAIAPGLRKKGLVLEEDTLAAVRGSETFAIRFLKAHAKSRVSIHYCPVALKDAVQTRQRYLRRAHNVKRPYEEVTEEGLLVKAVVTGPPNLLAELRQLLIEEVEVPPEMLYLPEGGNTLEGPAFLFAEKEVLELIRMNDLEVGIAETLPLDTRDLCEYDPL